MHCVDFMQSTGLDLGLLDEQGGEEAHALINPIKRRAHDGDFAQKQTGSC